MKIDVKVIPAAKKNHIKQEGDLWKIYLKAPAIDGKANKSLIALLAEHFDVRKGQIEIIKGLKLKRKTINIEYI